MKYFIKRGLFLLAPFLLFNCSGKSDKGDFKYSNLIRLDSIELKMPEKYLSFTKWNTHKFGSRNFLVEYGIFKNGNLLIHRADFSNKKYLPEIQIPREGPNGFNSSDASVFFSDPNSIVVFPAARDRFFIYDTLGMKKSEFRYQSAIQTRYFSSGFFSNGVKINGNLLIPTINDTRFDAPNYFEKVKPVSIYGMDKEGFLGFVDYPKYTYGKVFPSNLTGASISGFKDNEILINYSFSDSLYVFNHQDYSIRSIFCGLSGRIHPKGKNRIFDRFENLEYQAKEVNYESVFYHGDKIYRIVSHLIEDSFRSLSLGEIFENDLRIVTLIELDSKTEEIKYYRMPWAKYFVFESEKLYVGGVSVREEDQDTFRSFYIYDLNSGK